MKNIDLGNVWALGLGILFLMAFLLYLVFKYKIMIKRQKEKIVNLKQLNAQEEARLERKVNDAEEKILELTHTVKRLNNNINEGTKNQVVTKINAQQNKRARELKRTGLEEG